MLIPTCNDLLGKSPILAGLARWDQNIGRFSINLGDSGQVDIVISGPDLVFTWKECFLGTRMNVPS